MSSIHLEILDDTRRLLFSKLSSFRSYGYLGGGTALALQINHRKSYDFDIFTKREISAKLKRDIMFVLGDVSYSFENSDQLNFVTQNNIAVTFLWYYFKPIRRLIPTQSLDLASYIDIAADKAYTMGRRAQWRDYVDIYWMLREVKMPLEHICNFAKKKFGGTFSEIQFLEQLVFFNDITITPIDFIDKTVNPETIKKYLLQTVTDYTKKKTS